MDSLPRPVLVLIALVTTAGWAANLISGLLGGPTDGAVNGIFATLVGSGLVFGAVRTWRGGPEGPPDDREPPPGQFEQPSPDDPEPWDRRGAHRR